MKIKHNNNGFYERGLVIVEYAVLLAFCTILGVGFYNYYDLDKGIKFLTDSVEEADKHNVETSMVIKDGGLPANTEAPKYAETTEETFVNDGDELLHNIKTNPSVFFDFNKTIYDPTSNEETWSKYDKATTLFKDIQIDSFIRKPENDMIKFAKGSDGVYKEASGHYIVNNDIYSYNFDTAPILYYKKDSYELPDSLDQIKTREAIRLAYIPGKTANNEPILTGYWYIKITAYTKDTNKCTVESYRWNNALGKSSSTDNDGKTTYNVVKQTYDDAYFSKEEVRTTDTNKDGKIDKNDDISYYRTRLTFKTYLATYEELYKEKWLGSTDYNAYKNSKIDELKAKEASSS